MKQNSLCSRPFLAVFLLVLATTTTTTTTNSLPLGANNNNNNNKKYHKKPVRGGFIPKHHNNRRLILPPPRMAISTSRLAHKKRRGQMLKSPPLTMVRYANEDVLVLSPFSNDKNKQLNFASQKPLVSIKSLDACIFLTYFCSSVAMSLPVLLLPMAASEFSTATTTSTSSLVVSVTSKALLGGAVGKCINGFLCQEFGGKPCSVFHLMGTAVCSLFFSMATTPTTLGMAHAGIEFFVSIQWTALSVILAQHYSQDAPSCFSKGITTLSLASTCGQLVAKFGGVSLLQTMDWRMVAQLGAVVALLGSCLVGTLVVSERRPSKNTKISEQQQKPVSLDKKLVGNMTESARAVLSNPLFWGIATAHAMSMVARSSDRILGEFFAHATNLPRECVLSN